MNRGLLWLLCMTLLMIAAVLPTSVQAQDGLPQSQAYLLGTGDVLEVRVWDEEDLSGDFTIGVSGTVDLPLVGVLNVGGRSVEAVAEELQARLEKDYLVEPQVTVNVKTHASQPVLVQGAVRKPNRYILSGRTTLLEILAEAGGVVVEKSSQEIHLKREGSEDTVVIRLEPLMSGGTGNVVLQSGDVIYVPENEVVYVSGQVVNPGAVIWRDGMTIVQAVTEAGGTSPGANLRKAYVLRGGDRIEINLKRVIRGTAEDILLFAGDQLFVDESVL